MTSDDASQLVTAVLAASAALLRESERLLRPHGLTAAQFNVLRILADEPEGLSQRALGDRLVVDRSSMTGLLDRMERAGMVRRTDHPEDRRVYQVRLTPAGRTLWEKAEPHYVAAVRQVTAGLGAKRRVECLATLRTLEANAARWSAE
ncbi:MAG: MarR family transcriptional regulator [Verrucomicrobia bacterium]|nr:MarR family transcriptional regulator [Verrucomicrobiota bacterium]